MKPREYGTSHVFKDEILLLLLLLRRRRRRRRRDQERVKEQKGVLLGERTRKRAKRLPKSGMGTQCNKRKENFLSQTSLIIHQVQTRKITIVKEAWTPRIRELVKTTILEQDPPNHNRVGGVCLHPRCLTSKDGVFVA